MTKKPPLTDEDKALWEHAITSIKALKDPRQKIRTPIKKSAAPVKPAKPSYTKDSVASSHRAGSASHGSAAGSAKSSHAAGSAAKPLAALDRATSRKMANGGLSIDAIIDLHGMTQAEASAALHRFILSCARKNHRSVLVITGKGGRTTGGVLRQKLPLWLEHPDLRRHVIGFSPAHIRHGGSGAFYVRLKRSE